MRTSKILDAEQLIRCHLVLAYRAYAGYAGAGGQAKVHTRPSEGTCGEPAVLGERVIGTRPASNRPVENPIFRFSTTY